MALCNITGTLYLPDGEPARSRTVVFDQFQPSDDCVVVGPENVVGIGWAYEGGEFIPPGELQT